MIRNALSKLMKKIFLRSLFLVLLSIPKIGKAQSVCGFFLQEFYYVNPDLLVTNAVDKIVFIGKMKGAGKLQTEVYLNSSAQKIKQFYSTRDTTYSEEFDNAELCDMVCRKYNDTSRITCNNFGMIENIRFSDGFRHVDYDSLHRPGKETWMPNKNLKIEREFKYKNGNLLDKIFVNNYQNDDLIGQECFSYVYNGTQLVSVEHLMKYTNEYTHAGTITFEYNQQGLITFLKGKDDFANFTVTVKYYSKDKLVK